MLYTLALDLLPGWPRANRAEERTFLERLVMSTGESAALPTQERLEDLDRARSISCAAAMGGSPSCRADDPARPPHEHTIP